MRFKKGKFLIMYNDHLEGREAWLSEDGHFGFCKFGSVWEVVHVGTGTFLWAAKTRKDCAQWLEEKGFNYIESNTLINGKHYIYPVKCTKGLSVPNWQDYPYLYDMQEKIVKKHFCPF